MMKALTCMSLLFITLLSLSAGQVEEDYELVMVVEACRHGAREPSHIYPFTADPSNNFASPSELTRHGEEQHFNLGRLLKERYIHEAQLLPRAYNPLDIYAQTTFKNRTVISATYQLRGLYSSEDFDSFIDNSAFPYLLNTISEQDDLVLHVKSNCAREMAARSDAEASEEFEYVQDYFFDNYLEKLEALVGERLAEEEMKDVCSYIYWAGVDGKELIFDVAEEDEAYCDAIQDVDQYKVSYGNRDLEILGGWEFVQVLIEFGEHLKFGTLIDQMPIFSKYYSQLYPSSDHGLQFPKFALFSGHAESLMQILDGLGLHHWQRPNPASALFFEFYRLRTQLYLKMFFHMNDEEGTEEILLLPGQTEVLIPFEEFVEYVQERYSDTSFKTLEEECAREYISSGEFFPGKEVVQAMSDIYGLVPPS